MRFNKDIIIISDKCINSLSNYLNFIYKKYEDKVPEIFIKWKLFDNYIQNKYINKVQVVSDNAIYITNKIFNQIQIIQNRRKIEYI